MLAVLTWLPLRSVWASEPASTADRCFDPAHQKGTCECLLSCKVFGEDSSQCSTQEGAPLDSVVRGVVTDARGNKDSGGDFGKVDMVCEGIKCIVKCAQQVGCLSEDIMGKCYNLEQREPNCKVDCSASCHRGPAMLLVVATIAMSLSFDR